MKKHNKQMITGIIVLSVAAMIPAVSSADSCVPAAAKQDKFSADLAKKGNARMKKAEKILAQITQDARKAQQVAADDEADAVKENRPPSKLKKAKAIDAAIPAVLLGKAQCAVIIPGEKTIGFSGIGGTYGAGISVCKGADGTLGVPAFVKLKGGTYGPQFGGKSTDQILLFMGSDAPEILQQSSLKLGGDISVAAGPLGRDASASAVANLDLQGSAVLAYSHSSGFYAGATLNGAVLEPDTKMTDAVEGQKVKPNFLEKLKGRLKHAVTGAFQHSSDPNGSCPATMVAVGAAGDLNPAVNAPAVAPEAPIAVANSDLGAAKPAAAAAPAVLPAAPIQASEVK